MKKTALASGVVPTAAAGTTDKISDDLLRGAAEIADYTGLPRRRVYRLTERKQMPVFRLGSELCARKSTLLRWLDSLEAQSTKTITDD